MDLSERLSVEHVFLGAEEHPDGYIKRMVIKAGDVVGQHAHPHAHMSMLARGKVSVLVVGETPRNYDAPAYITLPARISHAILALEDAVWYCIWAVDGDGLNADNIDEALAG